MGSKSKFSGLLGPTRNNMTNVRISCNMEYWGTSGQGGICKDYKETGYCGYGDTCKFLHDRSDYKSGFQLDKEWEAKEKAKRERAMARMAKRAEDGDSPDEADEESSDDENPVSETCQHCDQPWFELKSDPVVTTCQHYFCEDCAFDPANDLNAKCPVCEQPTGGIFNSAEDAVKRLKS